MRGEGGERGGGVGASMRELPYDVVHWFNEAVSGGSVLFLRDASVLREARDLPERSTLQPLRMNGLEW